MLARVRSSPSPELAGRRPTATSTRSNVSVSLPSKRASIPPPLPEGEAGQAGRRRARRDDRALEAHLLGLVALHVELARALEDRAPADHVDAPGLGDRGEPAREPADDALALPLSQRIQRHARLAEI